MASTSSGGDRQPGLQRQPNHSQCLKILNLFRGKKKKGIREKDPMQTPAALVGVCHPTASDPASFLGRGGTVPSVHSLFLLCEGHCETVTAKQHTKPKQAFI